MKFAPIAIVGQSCILPGAMSPQELWKGIVENKNFLSQASFQDWNLDPQKLLLSPDAKSTQDKIWHSMGGHIRGFEKIFDPHGFAIDLPQILSLDTLCLWSLHCGREALKHLSWQNSRKHTAVVLGNLSYPHPSLNELAKNVWLHQNLENLNWRNRFNAAAPAHILSEALQLEGPSFCLDAACASSLYAIKNACDLLNSGKADLVISGGINAIEGSFLHLGFTALKALSPTGHVRPFSQDANGLIPSKGAAFVALRRLEDAIQLREPILGVIRGIGLSNDGRTGSLLAPSSKAQQIAIQKAYESADLEPSDLSLLEVHATGTLVGDSCELETLQRVFSSPLTLGSLKFQMGHLLAASGAAALIKVLGAFKHKILPAFTIENALKNLESTPFQTPQKAQKWEGPIRVAGINAFGFGGNNAHLILEDFEPSRFRKKNRSTISSKKEALAIVGIGIQWGIDQGKESVQRRLLQKEVCSKPNRIEFINLDLDTIKFPPKDLEGILPQQIVLIPTIHEALKDLNHPPGENTGILVGMGTDAEACRFKLRLDLFDQKIIFDETHAPPLDAIKTLGCMPNIPANRFNLMQDWKGSSYTVFAEERSGLEALNLACHALENHEVDTMIVAAVDLSCEPVHEEAVRRCLEESKHGSADAAVALVLKRQSDAQRDGDTVYQSLEYSGSDQDSSSEFHQQMGYSHAASGLLNTVAKILKNQSIPTKPHIAKDTSSKMIKIKAHLPTIEIPVMLKSAPRLAPILPLYFEKKECLFDKSQLLEHASGSLEKIFGESFQEVDSYPVRVSMPEAPLLLTDRVIEIDAEKGSMGCGYIVTETDIHENDWFLHNGRMLAGPAIEAGQSDLFLISYLGVDFENKGQRAYRLLGCEAKFLRDLPKIGETLRFKITIDRHVKNGKSRLFFFHYDCWIGDELFLQVKNGQAGFFSREELDASQGVIWNAKLRLEEIFSQTAEHPIKGPKKSFSKQDVLNFSNGNAYACFGQGYEVLASHSRTPSIPKGMNQLFDEVPILDPRGYLKVTRNLSKSDWFFAGHFKNDPCMPGTLMTEMAFQALSFYVAALGYTLPYDAFRFVPAFKEDCKLTCRGQILPESQFVEMEVFVKKITKKPILTAHADVLLTVDGLKALLAENLAVQLQPDWLETKKPEPKDSPLARFENILCDETQIAHTVHGIPSLAFGPKFSIFNQGHRPARLPGYPYTFISRIRKIDGPYGGMQTGSRIRSEWEIPENHPLLTPHSPEIPFSVLLEALLQPCGWLASYIGCPLASSKEIFFRNLEGELLLLKNPELKRTLHCDVTITSLVRLQDTIILEFAVKAFSEEECIIELKTRFGYFTFQALSDQKGLPIRNEEETLLKSVEWSPSDRLVKTDEPKYQTIFSPYLQLLDQIKTVPQDKKLFILAEKEISPEDWYFKAHFFQDPVMPGSLGLEAMIQSLKVHSQKNSFPQWFPLQVGKAFSWKYRGQVLPHNKTLQVLTDSSGLSSLFIDGKKIYEAKFEPEALNSLNP